MTEVIDKSDKHKNLLKIKHTNLHPEKRADRKIIRGTIKPVYRGPYGSKKYAY